MSYIPAKDADALSWMNAFSSGISANSALYQLSSADAASIASAVAAFESALDYIDIPAQKNKVSVAAKDDARTSAEQICRQFAQQIKLNSAVSDPDKIAIGVRPVNTQREPIPVPQSQPLLSIYSAAQGTMTLRYADANTPDSPKRPFGADSIQLWVAVGEEPVDDAASADFVGLHSRNPIVVAFTHADDKKSATYFARWCNNKGDVGPWSVPISMSIAA